MNSRWGRWATLLGLALLAFGLRAYRLQASPLHGDEAFNVLYAARPWGELIRGTLTIEPNPPSHFLLLRGWMALAGQGEFAVRFPSLVLGCLAVALCYPLAAWLFGHRIGYLALFLAAINPFYLWYSQEARGYTLLAASSLASLALALRLLEIARGRATARVAPTRGVWLGYVLTTVLALYTHYFAALIVLAENLVFVALVLQVSGLRSQVPGLRSRVLRETCDLRLATCDPSRAGLRWLAAQGAVAVLFAPWLVLVLPSLLGHEKTWIGVVTLPGMLSRLAVVYSLGPTASPGTAGWLAPLFGLVALLGLGFAWRRRRRGGLALALAGGVPPAMVFLISQVRPAFHERYLIAALPAYLVFLACGLAFLLQGRRWPLGAVALLAITLGSAQAWANYLYNPGFAKAPDWRALSRALRAQVRSGDVVVQNYPDPALAYYLDRPDWHRVLPAAVPIEPAWLEEDLVRLVAEHPRIWLLPQPDPAWDAGGLVEAWLDSHVDKVRQGQVASFRLNLYLTPLARSAMHPVNAVLGGRVALLGYDLDRDRVERGGTLYLTLFWQALQPMPISYKVFTHLIDGQGRIWGQEDGIPQKGRRPTTGWVVEEIIADEYAIPVSPEAPPGEYYLEVGLYDGDTGERLPAVDASGQPLAQDRVLLGGGVEVGP